MHAASPIRTVHSHQSLMTRVAETQRRATLARDERRAPRREKPSYVERYRGTEFESTSSAVASQPAPPEPMVSRGRLLVLTLGLAAVGIFSFIATSPILR
jgi:hypothetical protein